jgi:hypothetical protein
VSVSIPYTVAGYVRESASTTLSSAASLTTCRLVRIQPSASKMTPDPTPCAAPKMPVPLTWMVTTAGDTCSAALMTALDSSIRTSLTGTPPSSPGSSAAGALAAGAAMRLVIAAAPRPPESRPATMARARTGTRPGPRRTTTCCGAPAVGRLDHAGADPKVDGGVVRIGGGP